MKISESDQIRGRSLKMKSEPKKHANHTFQSPVRSMYSWSDEKKYRESSTENCQNENRRTEQIEQPSYGTLNKVTDMNKESKEEGPRVIEQRRFTEQRNKYRRVSIGQRYEKKKRRLQYWHRNFKWTALRAQHPKTNKTNVQLANAELLTSGTAENSQNQNEVDNHSLEPQPMFIYNSLH